MRNGSLCDRHCVGRGRPLGFHVNKGLAVIMVLDMTEVNKYNILKTFHEMCFDDDNNN